MDITLNNLYNYAGRRYILFDEVPNIITVKDTESGSTSQIVLTFKNGFYATGNSQYAITILDNTISNVLNPQDAVGQNFYGSNNKESLAFSAARALRACPNVTANYNIGTSNETVTLTAKQIGSIFSQYAIDFETNIPSTFMTYTKQDGNASNTLHNANIQLDITYDVYQPLAVMEKNMHNGRVDFDISKALSTLADYGRFQRFSYGVSALNSDGQYINLWANASNAYDLIAKGYKTKYSNKFLTLSDTPQIALAVDRGTSRNVFNNTLLYIYDKTLPVTVYVNSNTVNYTITYYDSAMVVLGTQNGNGNVNNFVCELDITLSDTYFNSQCFYIDLTIGGNTVRYNLIKPLKMTEENTRIYWRNEYGGIQFFDFTGQKSQTEERSNTTYHNGNAIFEYYDTEYQTKPLAYENNQIVTVNEKINVQSHLIEKDGIWQFDSLARAKKAWTIIGGTQYDIIIDSVSVEETEQNNIYRASVQFHTAELQ